MSSEPVHFLSNSEAETDRLAAALAMRLRPGDVICLNGSLGAGKTRFVQGVAKALGAMEAFVNSPTFILVQEYDTHPPIFHMDAYRLKDSDEFFELGGEELLESGGVAFIEWAERIADVLPRRGLTIQLSAAGETSREFRVVAEGRRGEELLAELHRAIPPPERD
jgi:tRNA threonylcarbamoyladenosine biosynthesis protein TsaE